MMHTSAFLFAIWGILLTPGPTNTLLALSGASVGFRRSVPLMPLELAAYLLVAVPLAWVGSEAMAARPLLGVAVRLCAAAWVMFLAVKLWRTPKPGAPAQRVTRRRVFVTTLLNPKALVFGLVLLPPGTSPQFLSRLGLFCLSVVCVASLWARGGAMLNRRRPGVEPPLPFRRVVACWLGVLALGLVRSALPGA